MTADIEQTLRQAVAHHRVGQLNEAETLYRSILLRQPDHPEANHNIGTIALQNNQLDIAQMHFMQALETDPARGEYWLSYIDSLFRAGQLDAARQIMAMARQSGLHGKDVDALENRLNNDAPAQDAQSAPPESNSPSKGNPKQGKHPSRQQIDALVALFNQARYREAEIAAREMTVQFPSNSFGWATLGVVLQQMGHNEEALPALKKAVALAPKDAQAHSNLGNTLSYLGRLDEAVASFRRAIQIDKNFAEAHLNLGATLHELGRFDEAAASYRQAIRLKPGLADAHFNLGNTLKSLNRFEEAEGCYRTTLQLSPNHADASSNLGVVLQSEGRLEEAESVLRQSLTIRQNSVESWSNLGSVLHDMGRLEEARQAYERALQLKPEHADVFNNLGNTLMNIGQLDEAEHSYRRALELKPDQLKIRSNLLFSLNYSAKHPPEYCLAEARHYGQLARAKATPYTRWPVAMHPEKLRIGFVSADFRKHPVGYFLENVLAQLTSRRLELIAYPTYHQNDELTARIKPYFSEWKPLYRQSDAEAARLIHDDRIHILIDLSGHTRLNRLPVFAWKPAPIQIAWLGYFATTGMAEIDYIVGDPYVAPHSEAAHFTEHIWQLPESYWCFSQPDAPVEVSTLPALANGHITFGCFNNLAKMNDAVVALWAKILKAVPGSRLFLKYGQLNDRAMRQTTLNRYAAHGISAERLILEAASSRTDYLACYHRVDIALDPFPYPGGTTSMESLWMGVPVLTLHGNRFLSHAGETILSNAGLKEWIAAGEDDYLGKAAAYAADLPYLSQLRAALRQQVLTSPLFDAPRFASNFEQALWKMWAQRKGLGHH